MAKKIKIIEYGKDGRVIAWKVAETGFLLCYNDSDLLANPYYDMPLEGEKFPAISDGQLTREEGSCYGRFVEERGSGGGYKLAYGKGQLTGIDFEHLWGYNEKGIETREVETVPNRPINLTTGQTD